jgi:hypothetical protein
VLFVSILVSMEINRRRYFRSGPRIKVVRKFEFFGHVAYIWYIPKYADFYFFIQHLKNSESRIIMRIVTHILCVGIFLKIYSHEGGLSCMQACLIYG